MSDKKDLSITTDQLDDIREWATYLKHCLQYTNSTAQSLKYQGSEGYVESIEILEIIRMVEDNIT